MKHLLLLHGALGTGDDLNKLQVALEDSFIVHVFHFSGHGGLPLPKEKFSIDLFVQDVLNYLKKEQLETVNIFGYSMGGYVGMYLARHAARRVEKLATLGTKFNWDEEIAAKETSMMNPVLISQKVPVFAQQLQQKHSLQNWEEVLGKTAAMLNMMGSKNPLQADDYALVQQPVLLLSGDRDKMVSAAETISIYKQLPDASVGILPSTPHLLDQVDTELLAFNLKRFFLR
ncbi:MAG: alpha/beta fold hydrolase [Chitinophagaceae bacterium]